MPGTQTEDIHNPHDKFFREAMSYPEVARSFFESYLPEEILKITKLDTMKQEKEGYIHESLRESAITDILYSVEIAEKRGYFYILVEHMRTSKKLMPFRVMCYIFHIMKEHLKKHGGTTLPLVFPIVLYNGGEPYRHTTDIFKLFRQHEQLARKIFLSPFLLLDLAEMPDQDLKGKDGASILTMFLKHVSDKEDALPWLKDILPEIRLALEAAKQGDNINSLMRSAFAYLFNSGNINDPKQAIKIIREQLPPKKEEENIMTIADYLKGVGEEQGKKIGEEIGKEIGKKIGKKEGIQEGRQETQQVIARRLIKANILSTEEIASITGVSMSTIHSLQEKETIH